MKGYNRKKKDKGAEKPETKMGEIQEARDGGTGALDYHIGSREGHVAHLLM
jgi:hypothetical protein